MSDESHFNRAGLVNEHGNSKVPITQEYKTATNLGEGTFGTVCKATNKKTKEIVAIKNIAKKTGKKEDTAKFMEKMKEETRIMKELDHPNIVRLFETYEDAKCLYLVMELCEGGELFDRIIDEGFFSEHKAAEVMQQILSAIVYMHEKNIVHRDLKPENFLLVSKDKDSPLKVIDFGLSCRYDCKGGALSLKTKAGTPYYVAPEVLKGSYNHVSDVWSCGVLMYVLLCGYPPFYGDSDPQILDMVKKGEYDFPPEEWEDISKEATQLIDQLLTFDPTKRVDAAAALKSAWFQTHKDPAAKVESKLIDNMKKFRSTSKLKKVILTAIARSLPAKKIKELTAMFKAMDVNGDGTLTYQEVMDAFKKNNQEVPADLQAIMKDIDTDGSGQLDYTEFLAATLDKRTMLNEENAWMAFRQFDLDGDGKITSEELQTVLGADGIGDHYDMASIQTMIKEADSNGDGSIDFEEFCQYMVK